VVGLVSKETARKILDAIYNAELKCYTTVDTLRRIVPYPDLDELLKELEKEGLVKIEDKYVIHTLCTEVAKAAEGIRRKSKEILREVNWDLLDKYSEFIPDSVIDQLRRAINEAAREYAWGAFLSKVSRKAERVCRKLIESPPEKAARERIPPKFIRNYDIARIVKFAEQFRTFEDFKKAFERQAVCGVKDKTMVFGVVPERVVEDFLAGGPQKKMVARKEIYNAIGTRAVLAVGVACEHFLERFGITLEDIWTKYLGRVVGPEVEEKKPETLEEYVRQKAYEVIGSAVLKYFEPVLDSLVKDIAEKAIKLPEDQREKFVESELKKFFDEITVNYVPLLKAAGRYKSYENFYKAVKECIVCGIPEESPTIVVVGLLPRDLCEKCKIAREECVDEVQDRFELFGGK